ncbi:MAG: hypothetical protein QOG74_1436, partial [Alphaproteobacteria bacterium]|nr:hypothetical protein [Alphaproteobacteria bacterium]
MSSRKAATAKTVRRGKPAAPAAVPPAGAAKIADAAT